MKTDRISTLKVADLKVVQKTKFVKFLSEYSEIAFIYTAIPAFLLMIIGQITGILIFVHRNEYYRCKNDTDMLWGFLIGQMIFYYSFTILYANLLFQLIPYLNNLTASFVSVSAYFIFSTIWSLWGIDVLVQTGCTDSVYSGVASFTISFTLLFDLALGISFIVLLIKKRKSFPVQKDNAIQVQGHDLARDKDQVEQSDPENGGWKEENLDDF